MTLFAADVGRRHGALLVGRSPGADLRIVDPSAGRDGVSFDLEREGESLGSALATGFRRESRQQCRYGCGSGDPRRDPPRCSRKGVRPFAGVSRRFEHRGDAGGVRFVDDYAHLPTEVRAVLEAARSTSPGRLVVVFQPHRYSRTAALSGEFGGAFSGADVVVLTDVYPAGEDPVPGITGKLLADAVIASDPDTPVHYVARRDRSRAPWQPFCARVICVSPSVQAI